MKRLSLAFRCFFSLLVKGRISETLFAELRTRVSTAPASPSLRGREERPPLRADWAEQAPSLSTGRTEVPPGQIAAQGTERAVQMLALLQRDGRLVDFFAEDIAEYDDAQVGAAVRDMHESCRGTLNRYLTLQPVVAGEEGKPVTIEGGIDPATIKLIGNVTGKLPVRGVLRHHGWRAADLRLPDLPAGGGRAVIAPAEVEVA